MLESLEKWLEAVVRIQKAYPVMGYFLVSIVAGIAAYIREWETDHPERTFKQHALALVRKTFFALFAGFIWYLLMLSQAWETSPFGYLGASVVGLYSTQFIDLVWQNVMRVVTNLGGPKK